MPATAATLEDAARNAVGNWHSFGSFCWFDRPDDADDFAIFYTHQSRLGSARSKQCCRDRQSPRAVHSRPATCKAKTIRTGPAAGSQASQFVSIATGRSRRHSPSGTNFKSDSTTIPILDESDYSNREYDAAIENIAQRRLPAVERIRPAGGLGRTGLPVAIGQRLSLREHATTKAIGRVMKSWLRPLRDLGFRYPIDGCGPVPKGTLLRKKTIAILGHVC